ncbi:MAG: hypothetical protein RLY92_1436, partial [Chloroflexota bacterium]
LQNLFSPPQQTVPLPGARSAASAPAPAALAPAVPDALVEVEPGGKLQPFPTPFVAAPLPPRAMIAGTTHIWQHWNNCGPATLAMTLNFWGWNGTQANTAAALKPNRLDRNVSISEMAAFAESIGFAAEYRPNGTLDGVRQLLAAGFPIIFERDLELRQEGWAGHYALLIGYDTGAQRFITQDTFQGPELPVTDAQLLKIWRPFNYAYLVVLPAARHAELLALLGAEADTEIAYSRAAQRALKEIRQTDGTAQAMTYYNLGINLHAVGDIKGARSSFDQARTLGIPYRMLWYQPEIYAVYFEAQEFNEVIQLANFALATNQSSEEAFFWRGRANEALANQKDAIRDYAAAAELNANYEPPRTALTRLGVAP